MSVQQITSVVHLSKEEFESKYMQTGTPVVLEDAALDWPAVSKWTSEYLTEKAGNLNVGLRAIDPRKSIGHTRTLNMAFADYLSSLPLAKSDDPYVAENPISEFPSLISDIGQLRYSPNPVSKLKLLISANSVAPLHYHVYTQAVSYQIAGTRRFVLLPPSETPKLDPRPSLGPLPNFARRLLYEVSLAATELNIFETTLTPGQAIFIPLHWWHTVFAGPGLSALLVDFFEYAQVGWPKSEVSSRVDELRKACLDSIKICDDALRGTPTQAEKAFYLGHLVKCYKQRNDKKGEMEAILAAIRSLPERDYKPDWRERLDELSEDLRCSNQTISNIDKQPRTASEDLAWISE